VDVAVSDVVEPALPATIVGEGAAGAETEGWLDASEGVARA
jgi:hypothetical protein